MSDTRESDRFNDFLGKLAALAWLVLGGVAVLYFWRFHDGFSTKQEHWGQFGDFLGGTVNPILGFMSLLVLVSTLQVQRRVLQETKQQALLDEYQRVIASTTEAIDRVLAQGFDLQGYQPVKGGHDLYGICNVLYAVAFNSSAFPPGYGLALREHEGLRRAGQHFLYFTHMLGDFQEQGGSPAVARLYGFRYVPHAVVFGSLWPSDYPVARYIGLGLSEAELKRSTALAAKFDASEVAT